MSKEAIEQSIPLYDADGRLFVYACPRCLHVSAPTIGGEFDDRIADSKRGANQCCRCRTCGVQVPPFGRNLCDGCDAKETADFQARMAESEPEREASAARREAALSKALDQDAAALLRMQMSDISEDYYCSGWVYGLEYELWLMLSGGDRGFGLGELSESEVDELRRLSEKAGGWWRWDKEDGKIFVTLEEWQTILIASASATQ
jgi:hypothetical protein